MKLSNHPIWNGIKPYKKSAHLARFFLAKQYARLIPSDKFIGIVGSVGKTTTALACKNVLQEKYLTISTLETNANTPNLDPIFNLPMTILRVRPKIEKVILEMGIEHPGEMDIYLSLVKPKTAIVTRLTHEHTEYFGSLESAIENEVRIVKTLPDDGIAILNWDDINCRKVAEETSAKVIFYGSDQKHCHVWVSNKRIEDYETVFELNYGVERIEIKSKLLGFHQIYPIMAAAALGVINNISLTTIKRGIEKIEPAPHRLQVLEGINNSIILDDTYNAQPVAVEEALETLNQVSARRRVVVLGEMRELGEYSEKMHRDIARKVFADKIDIVIAGQGDAQYYVDELIKLGFAENRIFPGLQNPEIVSKLNKMLTKGDVVLIKGSRGVRLDEVVKKVVKGRR